MTDYPFFPRFEQLPATVPIFPLSGVLLLPRGNLPLNIFERRYINMVDDALSADRLIGMVQPRDEDPSGPEPPVYDVGCAGRITSFEETQDGRYLITLTGICRFRMSEELATMRGYRRVNTDWDPFGQDFDDPTSDLVDRERFEPALKTYLNVKGLKANWDAVQQTPDDRLVSTIAMICPFEPGEKQALLEARTPKDRAAVLQSLVEMAIYEGSDEDSPAH